MSNFYGPYSVYDFELLVSNYLNIVEPGLPKDVQIVRHNEDLRIS